VCFNNGEDPNKHKEKNKFNVDAICNEVITAIHEKSSRSSSSSSSSSSNSGGGGGVSSSS
jgi:uncharacterized membrane protein